MPLRFGLMRCGSAFRRLAAISACVFPLVAARSATSSVESRAPAPPELVAELRSKVALDPIGLDGDPYEAWHDRTPPSAPPGTVCGVAFERDGKHYRLATLPNEVEARANGWAVTHIGACGTCSTLQDLAVYLERPDLTAPVRRCGIMRRSRGLACLAALGFTEPCARTWYANARYTRQHCFGVCVLDWILHEPPVGRDGKLSACLQCDEDRAGPVFKATAGRTRRSSGIPSSIPRPAEDVAHVVHDYVPVLPATAE